MNCREWEELLDDLLAGRLPVEQRRRAREHLDGCAECAGLFAVARRNKAALGNETDSKLTAVILARTSGSPCERAAELISLPPEDLAAGDGTLLDLHRETCADCEALARSMAWVTEALPRMAELEPDAAFTADVLAACAETERVNPFTALLENVDRRWRQACLRPRFSLEAAYVSLLVLLLLFGTPISPWKGAPTRVLAVMQTGPEAALGGLAPEGAELRGKVSGLAAATWRASGARLLDELGGGAELLRERRDASRTDWRDCKKNSGELCDALLRLDLIQASQHMDELKKDLSALRHIWSGAGENESDGEAVEVN